MSYTRTEILIVAIPHAVSGIFVVITVAATFPEPLDVALGVLGLIYVAGVIDGAIRLYRRSGS